MYSPLCSRLAGKGWKLPPCVPILEHIRENVKVKDLEEEARNEANKVAGEVALEVAGKKAEEVAGDVAGEIAGDLPGEVA